MGDRPTPAAVASPRRFERVRIPHLDRSGTATVVEIEAGVPGAAEFVRATAAPIPSRGQLVTARPPSPTPLPTPRRAGARRLSR